MDSTKVPLGETRGPVTAYLDPDEIVAFALAVNDYNPRYRDGTAVPPTYPVVPGYAVMIAMPQLPAAALDGRRGGVHGVHDLRLHKPIVPGTHLHTTAERVSVVTSTAGMNVFLLVRSVDDAGGLVVEQYWSVMHLGEVTGGDHGPPPPDHTFPEEARERPVGRTTVSTRRDQTFRYAGASGDRARIHVSDEAARQMGFPGKFAQGLCTFGLAAGSLVQVAAGGDPTRVSRLAARFAAPLFPGDNVDVAVYDIGETGSGTHTYAFEADSAGRRVLKHGRLEVLPAG